MRNTLTVTEPLFALPARDLGARGSRAKVGGPDPAGPVPARAAAVLAAVPTWWEGRAREAGLSGRWLDLSFAIDSPTPGQALSVAPEASISPQTSAEVLGAAYAKALPPEVRARHGRHYTPSSLADHLWRMTRAALSLPVSATRLPGLVRDRACGAGALLLPPLREHVRASVRTDPQVALVGLPSVVEGTDADPNAAWLASVILGAEVLPLLAAVPSSRRRRLPALARCGDGLLTGSRPARVELQNPPYGRVRMTAEERNRWRHVLYGHANLYGLFMAAALEDLDDEGVLSALVPTSFTSGLYFSRLRQTLSEKAPLQSVGFVANRDGVFDDVLQETCLAVFSRRRARWTALASLNSRIEQVARVKSPRGNGPWLLPRSADDAPTAAAAVALPLRLVDVGYRCSTGPLVWNRRARDLTPDWEPGTAPVLWAADIDGGTLHRDKARDSLRYLRLREGDEDVLVLSDPAILIQRTTAPEQARRIVAAELSPQALERWGGRVVVENHVNVLLPVLPEPLLSRRTLAVVLGTRPLDRVMRSLSGSVAVSAYELEALRFPDAMTLRAWDQLRGEDLEHAVANAYRPH